MAENNTKTLLINSFKELIISQPFEKITIKKITDGAGVIRPTFYNHFKDKYEVFEVILEEELLEPIRNLISIEMFREAVKMIFTYFEKNQEFYENAFKVTGQNSFEGILTKKIEELDRYILLQENVYLKEEVAKLSVDQIIEIHTMNVVNIIKIWLQDAEKDYSAEKVFDTYVFLMTHNVEDVIEKRN